MSTILPDPSFTDMAFLSVSTAHVFLLDIRDLAIGFELLGEHLLLLGNQVWLALAILPLFCPMIA